MIARDDTALARAPPASRALQPSELAWIAVVPCAIAIAIAVFALGPPIGRALLSPGPTDTLWPPHVSYVFGHPEPVKHARFAIALLGPVLLAAAILASGRRRPGLRPRTIRTLVVASQALTLVFLVATMLAQHNVIFRVHPLLWVTFHRRTLVGAVVLPLVLLAIMRAPRVAEWIARFVPDTRPRRIACVVIAAGLTVSWLLTAINTEGSVGNAAFFDLPPWAMADTLAILDGRTPLVDFYALYGEVWAYVAAVPMYLLGATITVFTIVMTSISGLSLLAVYGIFRRVVRSSLLALMLYAPLLATSFFIVPSLPTSPASNGQIFSVWPMRYGGPYLLAWLTARQIDRAAPRRPWALFLAAGLVLINNLEFGLGAFAATLVALAATAPSHSRQAIGRLAADVMIGLFATILLVSAVTLVHAGTLPHFGFLLEYPRVYGTVGYTGMPMPPMGLHMALYVTFAAAIGVAAVRLAKGGEERLLTGMLAWSGVFGLTAATYYAGRSDLYKLVALFSAWCFALALLLVIVVRGLAARGWRRPSLVDLMVLVGFGLAVGSLHAYPTPWSQIARLQRTTQTPLYEQLDAVSFVDEHTRPGERVAILIAMGHRIARQLGIVNVAPYAFIEAIVTKGQMLKLLDAAGREHAHKVFVPEDRMTREHRRVLTDAGFSQRFARAGFAEWSDAAVAARRIARTHR